jgi:hypothetical protein
MAITAPAATQTNLRCKTDLMQKVGPRLSMSCR